MDGRLETRMTQLDERAQTGENLVREGWSRRMDDGGAG